MRGRGVKGRSELFWKFIKIGGFDRPLVFIIVAGALIICLHCCVFSSSWQALFSTVCFQSGRQLNNAENKFSHSGGSFLYLR